MTANIVVQQYLNDAILRETHVAIVYTRQAAQADNWGYAKFAGEAMKRAQGEMGHLDEFTDRMAVLGGELVEEMQLPTVRLGDSLVAQMVIVRDLEQEAIDLYNRAVRECAGAGDNVTRALFEKILVDEQEHWLYADQALSQVEQMGIENWLSLQR